jgi:hypothetical protein
MTNNFCFDCGHHQPDHLAWCPANQPAPVDYTEPRQKDHNMKCPTCHGSGNAPTDLLDRLNRPGTTGKAHPETSRKAGTTPRKGSQRLAVLDALLQHGSMTASQIASIINVSPNQTAARLLELHRDEFVRHVYDDSGEVITRETTSRNTGRVHQITSLGKSAQAQAHGFRQHLFGGV